MGRWTAVPVALLLLAACGSGAETSPDAVESEPSSSINATVATTTTTEVVAPEPVEIEGRGRTWEVGRIYTSGSFAVPLTFTAPGPGWSSTGADGRWVSLKHDADGDGAADASLTIILFQPESPPDDIVDSIVGIKGVEATSPRSSVSLGGVDGVTVDVLGEPMPNPGFPLDDPCSNPPGSARFFVDFPGYALFTDDVLLDDFGIPACFETRAWVLDVAGTTVTALGVVRDNDRFDDLMPILEEFLDRNVAFG